MTRYEAETYFQWLSRADEILGLLQKHFDEVKSSRKWGKFIFVGMGRDER
jgi:hypothetical protein